jgi:hypothetical protein
VEPEDGKFFGRGLVAECKKVAPRTPAAITQKLAVAATDQSRHARPCLRRYNKAVPAISSVRIEAISKSGHFNARKAAVKLKIATGV